MNIFLPYESVDESVKSLDDKRLNKQILECYQILQVALGKSEGYAKHPVTVHYKNSPEFLSHYGLMACMEYVYRFDKLHKLTMKFVEIWNNNFYTRKTPVAPFYAEYSKDDPRCIRTTENVYELFQKKLIKKWQKDDPEPKWTGRSVPKFYKDYLEDVAQVCYEDHKKLMEMDEGVDR